MEDHAHWHGLLRAAYRGVLRREVRADELRVQAARLAAAELSPERLLEELIDSPEFAGRDPLHGYCAERDPRLVRFRSAEVDRLSARLRDRRPLDRTAFDALWRVRFEQELADGEPERKLRRYGEDHRRRFWETLNAMAILLEGQPAPRVLDFGISVFLWFYRRVFPGLELVTSDRPVGPAQQAFFEFGSRNAGAVAHVTADLADPGFLSDAVRAAFGTFDLILLTEVIEHLPAHPVRVLRPLLELLRPGGRLYLTTPNCFSRHHLERIAGRINPQPVFPFDGNGDGAHHYREMAMPELLEFVAEAGGRPAGFYFSDCWDTEPDVQPPDQRTNLVVVAERR
jgi:SAM-dependent methyltransferase